MGKCKTKAMTGLVLVLVLQFLAGFLLETVSTNKIKENVRNFFFQYLLAQILP